MKTAYGRHSRYISMVESSQSVYCSEDMPWHSYKGKYLIGMDLHFRDLVDYHDGKKHIITQADMVLEKQLRFLYLDW